MTDVISAAKAVAEQYGQDQVIMLTWDKSTGLHHVVTYGKTKVDCRQAAEGGNKLKRALGWPEELCQVKPR